MCGIVGILGKNWHCGQLEAMHYAQRHRGPDASGFYVDKKNLCGLGHNRLSIIDLSESGRQPMTRFSNNKQIVFNGEIYNYLELRDELSAEYEFATQSDTEVLLAAFEKWGTDCLDHLIGMFAFIIWDELEKTAFIARDRFGVKPIYYHKNVDGTLFVSSEIKAIHAAGISREPNEKTWANYLAFGLTDHSEETFWKDIFQLSAGHFLIWKNNSFSISCWYDLAKKVSDDFDKRPEAEIREEYLDLMKNSVSLRFRADVPVGINLSGGVDSSTLLGLVHTLQNEESTVTAYTFATGDERYDELPWVEKMLEKTAHPLIVSVLNAEDVPDLAVSVQYFQDEPFGGFPTLAYAKLFEQAHNNGTKVLLDGNGMDEQWAGYDYYQTLNSTESNIVQGIKEKPVRPECLTENFRSFANSLVFPNVFPDKLRNTQYRDIRFTKIPRAMRFNDRISMRSSTELREPFLDHRLFELAFRQPLEHKIVGNTGKVMLRKIVKDLMPEGVAEAPKRPLQTPQREWLSSELRSWANDHINNVCNDFGGIWLNEKLVKESWKNYCNGANDNSFYIWQWINLSLAMNSSCTNLERKYVSTN
jgi:asparagine synthase (glutamine-hydrolysing)